MSHLENINTLFTEIKTTDRESTIKKIAAVLAIFPLITLTDKKAVVEPFYKWAKEHAAEQPLTFAYAGYMSALVSFFAEDFETTARTASEVQLLFLQQNDPDGAALCSSVLGSSYRALGNVDLALKELWEAYEQLKKSRTFMHNMLACGYQIGSIYLENNNYANAIPLFAENLEIAEGLQNQIWIINLSHGLGKAYLVETKMPEAKRYLEDAMRTAEKINNPHFISLALSDLGDYYLKAGDNAEAIRRHTHALAIRDEHKYTNGSVTNRMRLGEIAMTESRYSDAVTILNTALQHAEQVKVKPKIYQLHQMLADVYEKENNTVKSLEHYKLFHQLREEVEVEEAAKKIKNLQMIFEAEQTKKENIIIKKQKAEIEQKNIELQETIDELTRTKVGKKAKAFTLIIAIVLFILEELILHSVLHLLPEDNFYLSFVVKMVIIFSLKPIDSAIEHTLLKKIIKKKKEMPEAMAVEAVLGQ